jgi:hypothetical protein
MNDGQRQVQPGGNNHVEMASVLDEFTAMHNNTTHERRHGHAGRPY